MNVKASLIASSIALLSLSANALEIDEKLTLRFLKVSSSKKTILINRGGEDGLVVGDHAKFFITAGVVARGVAEKVSPSRSIWSLYRVVDPNEITEDKVLNLKIASPVKITEDPSKSMKEEAIPGGTESMSMGDESKVESSSSDKEIVVDEADQAELEEMGMEKPSSKTKSPEKTPAKTVVRPETTEVMELPSKMGTNRNDNWEVWGMVYLNSLSGDAESGTETETTDATASTVDFSVGVERYFMNATNWFKNLSVSLFLHKRSTETGGDVKLTTDWSEYGGMANYHFYNNTYDLNRPVLFVTGSLGIGSVTNESAVATSNTTVTEDGDSKFFSVGIGAKYVMGNGFGGRALLDYYSTSETYTFSDETELTRSLSGPRIQFGLSYRF